MTNTVGAGSAKAALQWLVRKAKPLSLSTDSSSAPREEYQILGPYLSDQVRVMIKEQVLEPDDEICPENGYWFSLHEKEEVQQFLGVDGIQSAAVAPPARSEDATQPQVELTSAMTGSVDDARDAATRFVTAPPAASSEFNERFPRVSLAKSLGFYDKPKSPQILGVEKGKVWSFLFFLLATGALFGVLWLIRSLRA